MVCSSVIAWCAVAVQNNQAPVLPLSNSNTSPDDLLVLHKRLFCIKHLSTLSFVSSLFQIDCFVLQDDQHAVDHPCPRDAAYTGRRIELVRVHPVSACPLSFFSKMAQNLALRCVLVPAHLWCRGQNTSPIQNEEVYATLYLHLLIPLCPFFKMAPALVI